MIDVATVPPLHYGTTKTGRLYANDDQILEVAANKRLRHSNCTFLRPRNASTRAVTVVDAGSTEKQSVTREDEAAASKWAAANAKMMVVMAWIRNRISVAKFPREDAGKDIPAYCQDVPRDDCSAILSKECIAAPRNEYIPEQPVHMGENKEFPWKEMKAYYWGRESHLGPWHCQPTSM